MNSKIAFLGLAGAMSLMFASCSVEETDEILKGEAISFNTRVSRATEVTQTSLTGFRVYADADGYSDMFINGEWAKRVGDTNVFTLPTSYYWPQGVHNIRFWAYAPYDGPDATPVLNPSFSVDQQGFGDYTPEKSMADAGKNHHDIVVAYNEVTQSAATGSSVELNFHHALSQIEVKAILGEGARKGVKGTKDKDGTEGMIVYIKGAWIMNVAGTGHLDFDKDDVTTHIKWTKDNDDKGNYGRLSEKMELSAHGGTASGIIVNGSDLTLPYSLMLIPQKLDKYEFAATGTPEKKGAYILVLCRVETVHKDTNHDTSTTAATGGSIIIGDDDKTHIHQMFPVSDDFNDAEFGYTCVPIDTEWLPGKKYVYTLQFCGTESGAGVYPPELPDMPVPDGVTVVPKPSDKNPGDPVLNNPLKFTVKVDEWSEAVQDVPKDM